MCKKSDEINIESKLKKENQMESNFKSNEQVNNNDMPKEENQTIENKEQLNPHKVLDVATRKFISMLAENEDVFEMYNQLKRIKKAYESYSNKKDYDFAMYGIGRTINRTQDIGASFISAFTKESIDERFELFYKNEMKLCIMSNVFNLNHILDLD